MPCRLHCSCSSLPHPTHYLPYSPHPAYPRYPPPYSPTSLTPRTIPPPPSQSLVDAKKDAKSLKVKRTDLAARVNIAKREIDTFREQLEAKRAERTAAAGRNPEEGEIIDEEEYTYIQVECAGDVIITILPL